MAFLTRLGRWTLRMLLSVDQCACVWLRGWYYVWVGGELPSADETISGFTGRRAMAGRRWALLAERAIDLAFGAGHCRRAAANDDKN